MRRTLASIVALASLVVATSAQAGSWQPHVNGRALSCMAFAATPVDAAMCYVGAPRFAGSRPMVFAAPQILAGGFSSPPNLIGTTGEGNGFILDSATAPASTNAYVNYDGTNVVVNAPTGKGFAFSVAGSSQFTVSNTGTAVFSGSVGSADAGFFPGNHANVFLSSTNASHTGLLATSNVADSSAAIGTTINNAVTLSTAGAKLLSVQNNGTEKFGFKPDSGLVFNTTAAPVSTDTGISSDAAAGDLIFNTGASNKFHQFQIAGVTGLNVRTVNANITNANGQVDVSHIAGGSGAPTSPTAGTGCGTSSSPTVTGDDIFPRLGVVCGSTGTGGQTVVSATLAHAGNTAYRCVWSPANSATAALSGATQVFDSTSTTTFIITAGATAPGAATYLWQGVCGQP